MFSNSSTKAGKVAFYILNSLKYTKRKDLEFKSEDSENIFIELNVTPRKPLVIGLIYTLSTNNFTQFQEQSTHTLNKLNHSKQEYISFGDYNTIIMIFSSNYVIQELVIILVLFMLKVVVTLLTNLLLLLKPVQNC